jgi:hypothetical protein
MARGLSPLHIWVLRKAARQSRVHYAEILVGFFGWKPASPLRYDEDTNGNLPALALGIVDAETVQANGAPLGVTLASPGRQRFSPRAIGFKKYRATVSALSRSCGRLMNRGLATVVSGAYSHWSAVKITDAGRAWVEAHPEPAT